uniref:Heterokaryon incompatibility domain-containing protein n=1 Tax=Fusarium oxysporum (strain Fo5176) TaxID=660025 RepID=A0A0D2XP99_FUSOF
MVFEEQEEFNLARKMDPKLRLQVEVPLLDLLALCDRSKATRARDHLFAVLGLSSATDDDLFRADYSSTFDEIVRRFGKAFVRRGQCMDLLYRARLNIQSLRFPSWIPDWTTKFAFMGDEIDYSSLGLHSGGLYAAAGNTQCVSWMYGGGCWWRTRRRDSDLSLQILASDYVPNGLPYYKAIYSCYAVYQISKTEKGMIGLVPLLAEAGDQIYVLNGGAVPFVLRKGKRLLNGRRATAWVKEIHSSDTNRYIVDMIDFEIHGASDAWFSIKKMYWPDGGKVTKDGILSGGPACLHDTARE